MWQNSFCNEKPSATSQAHLFIAISFFFLFWFLYFYLLGQMWQIKYKTYIKESNNKNNHFSLPQLPQSISKSPKMLYLCGFSDFSCLHCGAGHTRQKAAYTGISSAGGSSSSTRKSTSRTTVVFSPPSLGLRRSSV